MSISKTEFLDLKGIDPLRKTFERFFEEVTNENDY